MKANHKVTITAVVAGLSLSVAAAGVAFDLWSGTPVEEQVEKTAEIVAAPTSLTTQISNPINKPERGESRHKHPEISQLKRRIDELSIAESTEPFDEPLPDSIEDTTWEQAQADEMAWWEDTKAAYDEEPVDHQWAMQTSELFMTDIDELAAEHGFAAIQADCRSTRCSATVEWPSYSDAAQSFTELLHHSYQANCARHTLLPEPLEDDFDAPYQATVIFDCTEWRDGVLAAQ